MKKLITVLLMMIMLVSGATVASAAEIDIPKGIKNADELAEYLDETEYVTVQSDGGSKDFVIQVSGYIMPLAGGEQPGGSSPTNPGKTPKTGDDSQTGYLFLIMGLSAIAILLCLKARRDDDEEMQLQ